MRFHVKQNETPGRPPSGGRFAKKIDLQALREKLHAITDEAQRQRAAYWQEKAEASAEAEMKLAQHLDEAGGRMVEVTRVTATPSGAGQWKVLAKATHSSKGPVYRYGYVSSLLEVALLLERWNSKDEWTVDRYG